MIYFHARECEYVCNNAKYVQRKKVSTSAKLCARMKAQAIVFFVKRQFVFCFLYKNKRQSNESWIVLICKTMLKCYFYWLQNRHFCECRPHILLDATKVLDCTVITMIIIMSTCLYSIWCTQPIKNKSDCVFSVPLAILLHLRAEANYVARIRLQNPLNILPPSWYANLRGARVHNKIVNL